MRIRESAYLALACLFFAVNNSLAQFGADGLYNGQNERHVEIFPAGNQTKAGWDIQFLSQPKYSLQKLQAGSKAIFASQTQCEIYDFNDKNWSVHQLPVSRHGMAMAATGIMAYFAGGATGPQYKPEYKARVDIYNTESNTWHSSKLSVPRRVGAAGSGGSKVIFAGGKGTSGYSDRVDIFDAYKGGKQFHTLSEARDSMAMGSTATTIVIAGGKTGMASSPVSSDCVDIYEVHSGSWTQAKLSSKRHNISVASIGNRIIFAGGISKSMYDKVLSDRVDIYDATRNTWTQMTLSQAKYGMTVAVAGNRVYFAGGIIDNSGTLSDKLEIYDLESKTWSVSTLPAPRYNMAAGLTASRLMLAGGSIGSVNYCTDRIEVLDLHTGKWSVEHLSTARTAVAAVSYNNQVIFAGGTILAANAEHNEASATVDTWAEATASITSYANFAGSNSIYPVARKRSRAEWIYTDPLNDNFIKADLWKYETRTVKISVLDASRKPLMTKSVIPFGETIEDIDISSLTKGQYWILIESSGCKPVLTSMNIKGFSPDKDPFGKILAMSGLQNGQTGM